MIAFALGFVGCAQPSYLDAGADRQPIQARTFDVDSSGNAICPGEIYAVATEGRATCSRAPQRCASSAPDAARGPRIVCECAGADGGQGVWSCRQEQF